MKRKKAAKQQTPDDTQAAHHTLDSLAEACCQLLKNIEGDIAGIRSLKCGAVRRAAEVGKLLICAKSRLSHGHWLPWLKEKIPIISQSTASRYMRLAKIDLSDERNAVLRFKDLLQPSTTSADNPKPPGSNGIIFTKRAERTRHEMAAFATELRALATRSPVEPHVLQQAREIYCSVLGGLSEIVCAWEAVCSAHGQAPPWKELRGEAN